MVPLKSQPEELLNILKQCSGDVLSTTENNGAMYLCRRGAPSVTGRKIIPHMPFSARQKPSSGPYFMPNILCHFNFMLVFSGVHEKTAFNIDFPLGNFNRIKSVPPVLCPNGIK